MTIVSTLSPRAAAAAALAGLLFAPTPQAEALRHAHILLSRINELGVSRRAAICGPARQLSWSGMVRSSFRYCQAKTARRPLWPRQRCVHAIGLEREMRARTVKAPP